jgi:hypothetical protein
LRGIGTIGVERQITKEKLVTRIEERSANATGHLKPTRHMQTTQCMRRLTSAGSTGASGPERRRLRHLRGRVQRNEIRSMTRHIGKQGCGFVRRVLVQLQLQLLQLELARAAARCSYRGARPTCTRTRLPRFGRSIQQQLCSSSSRVEIGFGKEQIGRIRRNEKCSILIVRCAPC